MFQMNAFYYRLDKTMCGFSAYVAFNKATNGQTDIKHEKQSLFSIFFWEEKEFQLFDWLFVTLPLTGLSRRKIAFSNYHEIAVGFFFINTCVYIFQYLQDGDVAQWLEASEFKSDDPGFDPLVGPLI